MRLYSGLVGVLLLSCGTNQDGPELRGAGDTDAPAVRSYHQVVRSYHGDVAFDVTVRAGEGVSDDAVRRLLADMMIAVVPDEMAEPIAPRSADPNVDFGECDTLAAVTIQADGQSVDLARYAWTWPQDFEPVETTGVLRVAGSTCDVPDIPGALRWKWKWYGGNLMLERPEACGALVTSGPVMLMILSAVPAPWNVIAVATIAVYDGLIFRRMGDRGIKLEFNWSGTIHGVKTRPDGSKRLGGGWSNKCKDYVTFCTNDACMCEDAPDPVWCQCMQDGEVDDC
jgi:hypothetical protein